jgi:conjugal transfer pilus assembly protein TrbC
MILPIFFFSFSVLGMPSLQESACPARLREDSLKVVEAVQKDKDFQSFLADSLRQKDAVLRDKGFEDFVTDLQAQAQAQASLQAPQFQQSTRDKATPGNLYIFLSFSLGEKALLNLANEAKPYGATFVLRGFIDGSYAKTVQALQNIIVKTGQGFIIDPELFSLFSVTVVPTYVLAKPFQLHAQTRTQSPLHDRLQGHVSVPYALETFAQSGDLTEEAQALLDKRGIK